MLWLTSVICTILMMMAMFGAIQAGAGLIVVWAFAPGLFNALESW